MTEFENEIEVMVKVKFHYSKGQTQTFDQPGISDECEDIELEALPFEDQPKEIRESIIDMCLEAVENQKEYELECQFEQHIDHLKGCEL